MPLASSEVRSQIPCCPGRPDFPLPPEQLTAAAWLGVLCYGADLAPISVCSNAGDRAGHDGFSPPNLIGYVAQSCNRVLAALASVSDGFATISTFRSAAAAKVAAHLSQSHCHCALRHGMARLDVLNLGWILGRTCAAERARTGRGARRRWRPFRHAYLMLAVIIGWAIFRVPSWIRP